MHGMLRGTRRKKTIAMTPLIVDLFDGAKVYAETNITGVDADDYRDSLTCIGGQLEAYVTKTGGPDGGSRFVSLGIDMDAPIASFGVLSGAVGWGRLVWDGKDNAPNLIDSDGLGGIDVSAYSMMVVNITNVHPLYAAYGELSVRVYSGAAVAIANINTATAGAKNLPLLDFVGDDVWASVGAIELRFSSSVGYIAIDHILFK